MNGLIAFWSYALAACAFASIVLWRSRSRADRTGKAAAGRLRRDRGLGGRRRGMGPNRPDDDDLRDAAQPHLGHAALRHVGRNPGFRPERPSPGVRGGGAVHRPALCAQRAGVRLAPDRRPVQRRPDDRQPAAGHDVGRRSRPGSQCLWPGRARKPVAHPRSDARPHLDVGLRPQPRDACLSAGIGVSERRPIVPAARSFHGADGAFVCRDRRHSRARFRVKLSRAATFQSLSLLGICIYLATMAGLATAFRRSHWDWATASTAVAARRDDYRRRRRGHIVVGARLAQGQARQAPVRAPLRLSHRMASLYRYAWPLRRRRPAARRSHCQVLCRYRRFARRPAAGQRRRTGPSAPRRRGTGPLRTRPRAKSRRETKFWTAIEKSGRIIEFEGLRHGWADAADKSARRCSTGCSKTARCGPGFR